MRKSASYKCDFDVCFGASAEGRSGDICNACRTCIKNYRNNRNMTFPKTLDSNENKGVRRPSLQQSSVFDSSEVTEDYNESQLLHNSFTAPISPRKRREREESPAPVRAILRPWNDNSSNTCEVIHEGSNTSRVQQPNSSICKTNIRVVPVPPLVLDGPPLKFLGRYLPNDIVMKILTYLTEADIIMITFHFLIPGVQNAQNKTCAQLQNEKCKNENLQSVQPLGPLTQPQKLMLQKLITNRENNLDEDGCIVVPRVGSGGKARRYLHIPKTQIKSGDATKRTMNKRSKIIEKVEKVCSTPAGTSLTASGSDVHAQRVNTIKRDKEGYAAAAEEAGLKIVARFRKDTVLSLRSIMTLKLWRLLKRVFCNEVGFDVFGSTGSMIQEQRKMEFEYECGTVT